MNYNEGLRQLAGPKRAAVARAKQAHAASVQLAEIALERCIGPAKAAFEMETARLVEDFVAQRRAWFEGQMRAQHGTAYGLFEQALAAAQAQLDADTEAAEQPMRDYQQQYAAWKQEQQQREREAKFWASDKGQELRAALVQQEAYDKREAAFAVTTGWPPMHWLRWQHELWLTMGGEDTPAARYHAAAPLREDYLKHYPEQRAMIESPDQSLYAAWVAERGGENERPAMPGQPS